jgi:hypothetical protein
MTSQNSDINLNVKIHGAKEAQQQLRVMAKELAASSREAGATPAIRRQEAKAKLEAVYRKGRSQTEAERTAAGATRRGGQVFQTEMRRALDPIEQEKALMSMTGEERKKLDSVDRKAENAVLADAKKKQDEKIATDKREEQAIRSLRLAIQRKIEASRIMISLDQQLGNQSGLNAAKIQTLRLQIEQLAQSENFARAATQNMTVELQQQEVQLEKLQHQAYESANVFNFMAGSGQRTKTAIKNMGAAAQGAMLGMSALNGDIMGLAFSLIFLNFAANLKVALSFGAVAIAGALAFKQIKKIIERRKEVEQFGKSFQIVSGNVQGYDLAVQRASDILGKYSLSNEDADSAQRALLKTSVHLQRLGIEPTAKALDVVAKAFILARGYGEELADAEATAQEAGASFAEDGIIKMGAYQMSFEALSQDSARALAGMEGDYKIMGDTVGEVLDNLGIDYAEVLEGNKAFNKKYLDTSIKELDEKLRTEAGMEREAWEMIDELMREKTKTRIKNLIDEGLWTDMVVERMKEADLEYENSVKERTKIIVGELNKQIKEKQRLATVTEDAVKRIEIAEKRLLADRKKKSDAALFGSQGDGTVKNATWEDVAKFKEDQMRDLQANKFGAMTHYQEMQMLDITSNPNIDTSQKVEITINDQTSRGTLLDIVERNSGHLVIGNVGVSGEAGG